MEQELNTLKLVSYNDQNMEHRKFKRELLNDTLFQEYFGQMFIKKSDDIFQTTDKIEIKKAYLVEDNGQIVGMIRLFSYHESGVVNIQYAVRPCMRRKGYGTKILREFSDFLIKNNIHCIEGDIDKNNIGSIKIATDLEFRKENDKYRLRR
ncbi:GNAT family N-acetyltransferase [bacterium]|nr:GNAT family N-acetyltransferase [bacterium]